MHCQLATPFQFINVRDVEEMELLPGELEDTVVFLKDGEIINSEIWTDYEQLQVNITGYPLRSGLRFEVHITVDRNVWFVDPERGCVLGMIDYDEHPQVYYPQTDFEAHRDTDASPGMLQFTLTRDAFNDRFYWLITSDNVDKRSKFNDDDGDWENEQPV